MKDIWKYGRTGGEYAGKVLDDMLVSVPYTDQPPLEGIRANGEPLTIADQMFDPKIERMDCFSERTRSQRFKQSQSDVRGSGT